MNPIYKQYSDNFSDAFDPTTNYIDQWNNIQDTIVKQIDTTNSVTDIKYVGGMDISFLKGSNDAIGCLVIHDYNTLQLVGTFTLKGTIDTPYIPGYLAFREVPLLSKLLELFKNDYPELIPQVILMDGNGVWHPKRCGLASHFSIITKIPTVGVAKKLFSVDGLDRETVLQMIDVHKGSITNIYDINNKPLGAAYNVTGSPKRATYISVGSFISLDKAVDVVKHMSKHRINESIRQADFLSRLLLK